MSSIATTHGDGGQTGLAGGIRISKADLRVEAYGTVDELGATLREKTDATEQQIAAAVKINEDSRLETLRWGLLLLAGVSAVAVFPASRLPRYVPEQIPDPSPAGGPGGGDDDA